MVMLAKIRRMHFRDGLSVGTELARSQVETRPPSAGGGPGHSCLMVELDRLRRSTLVATAIPTAAHVNQVSLRRNSDIQSAGNRYPPQPIRRRTPTRIGPDQYARLDEGTQIAQSRIGRRAGQRRPLAVGHWPIEFVQDLVQRPLLPLVQWHLRDALPK